MVDFIVDSFVFYGWFGVVLDLFFAVIVYMFCWEGPYFTLKDSLFSDWGKEGINYAAANKGAFAGTDSAEPIEGGWIVEGKLVSNKQAADAAKGWVK